MKLELSQRQGLTLAMQTSMRLLQLNNLQLRNYIGELMTSNAVVELEYPEIDYHPSPFERTRLSGYGIQNDERSTLSKEQLMEDKAANSSAFHDLFLQSAAMNLSTYHHRILNFLIQSLDGNGFLTETVSSLSHILHVPPQDIQKCVALLQSMDPAGVGATDIRSCLCLQLVRLDPHDTVSLQIIAAHLEEMSKHQYGAISKSLHIPKAQVIQACERIRTLNPKPLNGMGGEVMTQYILPDFYILEDNGQLRCVMNDYFLPKIKIDSSYEEFIRNKSLSPEDSEYIQKNYRQAHEIVKFLDYRKSTLQRVVEYILTMQEDFFRFGPGHRASMTNREIAQALSLHESTVSRAVNGKFFECKWGVFPLKSLFIHSTKTDSDSGNYDQILHRIQELITSEAPGAAYSDQQLCDLLSAEGIQIARRTVAKYRQSLGFATASQRNAKYTKRS